MPRAPGPSDAPANRRRRRRERDGNGFVQAGPCNLGDLTIVGLSTRYEPCRTVPILAWRCLIRNVCATPTPTSFLCTSHERAANGSVRRPQTGSYRRCVRQCSRVCRPLDPVSGDRVRSATRMSASPRTSSYPLLFSPITLNKVTIKNRIVSTAHATGYAIDGYPKEKYRRYYERKAPGA